MAPGLLFVSLCIPLAFALPLSTHQLQPSTILARALEVDPQFRRPLFNIVWSSLITIATCTYSALHPNVPNPAATTREVFQERLWMTFFAILAPDMMILCAAMQRNAAKKIYEEFRHNDKVPYWSMTHAHFLQMGGFMIKDGEKNYDVLTYARFKVLLEGQKAQDDKGNSERKNLWPRQTINQENPEGPLKEFELKVSEQEIEHRSKGDLMAMVIASVQTWWFVIQCLVRFIARLNVTLIELTAFAFAIINIISWSLWMHKPHHVRLPIYLDLSGDRIPGPDFEKIRKKSYEFWKKSKEQGVYPTNSPLASASTIAVGELEDDSTSKTASKTQGQTTWRKWIPTSLIRPLLDAMGVNPRGLEEKVINNPKKNISKDHTSANADKDTPKDYTVENVGTYYTAWFKVPDEQAKRPTAFPKRKVALIGSAIAALFFGGIHCAGWAPVFEFPTEKERLLWRISSATMVSLSLAIFLATSLYLLYKHFDKSRSDMDYFLAIFLYIISVPYALARLTLLALAFTSLRDLPPSAYDNIRWISMFPHI